MDSWVNLHMKLGVGHWAVLEHYVNSVSSKSLCFSSIKWATNSTNLMGWSQGLRNHKRGSRTFLPSTQTTQRRSLCKLLLIYSWIMTSLSTKKPNRLDWYCTLAGKYQGSRPGSSESQVLLFPIVYLLLPSHPPQSFPVPSSLLRERRGWTSWPWGSFQHPCARWWCSTKQQFQKQQEGMFSLPESAVSSAM